MKELKPTSESYTNPLAQAFAVFKMNLYSSKKGFTPKGFDSLTYIDAQSIWNGKTLTAISNMLDSILTKYAWKKLPSGNAAYVGSPELGELRAMLNDINEAFYTAIALSNGDSVVANEGLRFPGMIALSTFPKLKKLPNTKMEELNPSFVTSQEEPMEFSLSQNYPNPFNPTTVINFVVNTPSEISLKVYDILGKEVATLLDNVYCDEKENEIKFDASNLSSGLYFYRLTGRDLQGNSFTSVRKMVVAK